MKISHLYRLLPVVIVTTLAQGSVAHAYLSPTDVFGGTNASFSPSDGTHAAAASSEGFDRTNPTYLPPNNRAAENEAALQQSQRNFQYADVQDIEVHAAAPAEDTSPERNLFDDDTQYQLRQERMQESNRNGNVTIVIGGEGGTVTSNGQVLHSGAPRVTATGPETLLMLLLLLLAGVSTVTYVHFQKKSSF